MGSRSSREAAAGLAVLGVTVAWSLDVRKRRRGHASSSFHLPRSRTNDEIKKFWDGFAHNYKMHFRLWALPALTSMVSALELADAESCLEIACGPGHGLPLLRRELGPGKRLVGCDVSVAMCELAKAGPAAAAQAAVLVADAQALPEAFAGAFDRVVACLCFHIVPDHGAALQTMFRATKPGGKVAFSVWGAAAASPMFTLFPKVLADLRASGALPPDDAAAAAAGNLRSSFHLGGDDARLRSECAAAGFARAVSWHVPCVWGRQDGASFAEVFTSCQEGARTVMGGLNRHQRALVLSELAARADQILAGGAPIACDVVVVLAEKPRLSATERGGRGT